MKAVLGILCTLALTGCGKPDPVERISGPTMGSTYSVQYVPPATGVGTDQVKREIESILGEIDQHFSTCLLYTSPSPRD